MSVAGKEKEKLPEFFDIRNLTHNSDAKRKVEKLLELVFPQGESDLMKSALRHVKVKGIRAVPVIYGDINLEYVYQKLVEETVSVKSGKTPAKVRPKTSDYEKYLYHVDGFTPASENKGKKPERLLFSSSYYTYACEKCKTTGKVSCTCRGGILTCDSCGGKGSFWCGTCNGSGKENCYICHGYGYTEDWNSYDGYVELRCSKCGGSGKIGCHYCGGSGKEKCSNCMGSGEILCYHCGGSRVARCRNCGGTGYGAMQIAIEQSFGRYGKKGQLIRAAELEERFKCKLKLTTHGNTQLIFVADSPEPFTSLQDPAMKKCKYVLDITWLMNSVINGCKKETNTPQITNYSCGLYRQDFWEVEFVLNDKTYFMMYDSSKISLVLTDNPVADMFADTSRRLDAARAEDAKRAVKKLEAEFTELMRALKLSSENCSLSSKIWEIMK